MDGNTTMTGFRQWEVLPPLLKIAGLPPVVALEVFRLGGGVVVVVVVVQVAGVGGRVVEEATDDEEVQEQEFVVVGVHVSK